MAATLRVCVGSLWVTAPLPTASLSASSTDYYYFSLRHHSHDMPSLDLAHCKPAVRLPCDYRDQVHRSPGFLTSVLNGVNDDGSIIKEFEASHGTVTDMWKVGSSHPTATNLSAVTALSNMLYLSNMFCIRRHLSLSA